MQGPMKVAQAGKKAGKQVLGTDVAQGVVEAVVDKLGEITVEKADDIAGSVKDRAAKAGGRRPTASRSKTPSRKKQTAKKQTAKKRTRQEDLREEDLREEVDGQEAVRDEEVSAKKTTAKKSTAKRSSSKRPARKKSAPRSRHRGSARSSRSIVARRKVRAGEDSNLRPAD